MALGSQQCLGLQREGRGGKGGRKGGSRAIQLCQTEHWWVGAGGVWGKRGGITFDKVQVVQ